LIAWTGLNVCSKGLSQVQTMETSAKILRKAVFDNEMSRKLAGVNDLIAAEGKYHLKCYTKCNQVNSDPRVTCFEEIMSSLEKGLCRGRIYSLKALRQAPRKLFQNRTSTVQGSYLRFS
jgi:hypothetical protein